MKLRVDDHLFFSLHLATQAFEEYFSPLLEDFNITSQHLIILMCLWEGLDTTAQEIELRTKLPASIVTAGLKNLADAGYVFKGAQNWKVSPAGRILERRLECRNREWQDDISSDDFCETLRDNLRHFSILLQSSAESSKAP